MTRTIKNPSGDADAKASARALLDAAEDLDVPAGQIRTVSPGARIAFSAPDDVFGAAGLSGGVAADAELDDPAAAAGDPNLEIMLRLTGVNPGGGADIRVTPMVEALDPPREVTVQLGAQTRHMSTDGDTGPIMLFPPTWTGAGVTITDDETGNVSFQYQFGPTGNLAMSFYPYRPPEEE